jgi:hypothetical protein
MIARIRERRRLQKRFHMGTMKTNEQATDLYDE